MLDDIYGIIFDEIRVEIENNLPDTLKLNLKPHAYLIIIYYVGKRLDNLDITIDAVVVAIKIDPQDNSISIKFPHKDPELEQNRKYDISDPQSLDAVLRITKEAMQTCARGQISEY